MVARKLYIASYDIRSNKRLHKALYVLKGYSCGGQYSCFECFLSDHEKLTLLTKIKAIINENQDSFAIVPVYKSTQAITLGAAVKPIDTSFYLLG